MSWQLALPPSIDEPRHWKYVEGPTRRVPVMDYGFKPPRVIRYVGWRTCMTCRDIFFSEDVARLRRCGGCKQTE